MYNIDDIIKISSSISTFILSNRLGIFSSSKGRVPHNRAYNITPQLHISTSDPEYDFPETTCITILGCD